MASADCVISACRAQAALGWLVLNANQLEESPIHPGSIAMAGDLNKQFFYPPPPSAINTLHSLQTILKVQAKRTLDTQSSRASTVAHVKMTLQNVCDQLQANKAVIFEGVFLTLCCQQVCVSCIWQCCSLSVGTLWPTKRMLLVTSR